MFKQKFLLGVIFPVLFIGGTAFGWLGTTHSLLCQRNFDLPVVSQFLSGVDQSAIENYVLEPDGHSGQWIGIRDRYYIDTGGTYGDFNYNALGETARLQALMHHLGDVSVPAHHAPAVYEYDSQWAEGLCEAAAGVGYTSVGELPNVANTCNYTHTQNGHSYNFTGTIDDVIDTFEDACRDNAAWYESTMHTIFGHSYHYPSDVASANWNGLKIDLMLQRAVMVDYFLAKEDIVVVSETHPVAYAGGNLHLSQAAAYDPDCISWNADGTYSQIYGAHEQGIQFCVWDFDGDYVWDYSNYGGTDITIPVNDLLAMGLTPNAWNWFVTAVVDNEGKSTWATDWVYISTGGGAPEPASLSLLAVGGLALLRRRKK